MVEQSDQMQTQRHRLALAPVILSALLGSAAQGAAAKPSIGQQFITGHNSITFSILTPIDEDQKNVETVNVSCDGGKCRVRIMRISQRACEEGSAHQGRGYAQHDELIQVEEHGPEEEILPLKVTPGSDNMLLLQYEDGGRDIRLRVLLRSANSMWLPQKQIILSGGVVGEVEFGRQIEHPPRFVPISEIVGSPIICRVRFQSR